MNVVLLVCRQVVVDHQGNLLDIDTSGQQVGGDQDSGRTGSELVHDGVSIRLRQVSMDGRNSEFSLRQSLSQRLDLISGIAEDNGLGDRDGVVQVTQTVELVALLLDVNEELLDTFKGQLVLLDQDSYRVVHEFGGDLQDVLRHSSGQKDDLGGLRQQSEDVVDLLLETGGQHLIGLIQDEHLDFVGLEVSSVNHVDDSTWSTNNNLDTGLEGLNVAAHGSTTDGGMDGDFQVQTNGGDDLLDLQGQLSGGGQDQSLGGLEILINVLQSRDGEGGGLTGTRLGLSQNVLTLGDWQDSSLLDCRWSFVTVTENTSDNLGLQVQIIERVDDIVVVGLNQVSVDFGDPRHDVLFG